MSAGGHRGATADLHQSNLASPTSDGGAVSPRRELLSVYNVAMSDSSNKVGEFWNGYYLIIIIMFLMVQARCGLSIQVVGTRLGATCSVIPISSSFLTFSVGRHIRTRHVALLPSTNFDVLYSIDKCMQNRSAPVGRKWNLHCPSIFSIGCQNVSYVYCFAFTTPTNTRSYVSRTYNSSTALN